MVAAAFDMGVAEVQLVEGMLDEYGRLARGHMQKYLPAEETKSYPVSYTHLTLPTIYSV